MLKQTDTKITRYTDETMGGVFYVDIVEVIDGKDGGDSTREAWLSHKEYGVATLMFGSAMNYIGEREFLEMVEANLVEYEVGYMREYMDE